MRLKDRDGAVVPMGVLVPVGVLVGGRHQVWAKGDV
jgi:hypothetical protein